MIYALLFSAFTLAVSRTIHFQYDTATDCGGDSSTNEPGPRDKFGFGYHQCYQEWCPTRDITGGCSLHDSKGKYVGHANFHDSVAYYKPTYKSKDMTLRANVHVTDQVSYFFPDGALSFTYPYTSETGRIKYNVGHFKVNTLSGSGAFEMIGTHGTVEIEVSPTHRSVTIHVPDKTYDHKKNSYSDSGDHNKNSYGTALANSHEQLRELLRGQEQLQQLLGSYYQPQPKKNDHQENSYQPQPKKNDHQEDSYQPQPKKNDHHDNSYQPQPKKNDHQPQPKKNDHQDNSYQPQPKKNDHQEENSYSVSYENSHYSDHHENSYQPQPKKNNHQEDSYQPEPSVSFENSHYGDQPKENNHYDEQPRKNDYPENYHPLVSHRPQPKKNYQDTEIVLKEGEELTPWTLAVSYEGGEF